MELKQGEYSGVSKVNYNFISQDYLFITSVLSAAAFRQLNKDISEIEKVLLESDFKGLAYSGPKFSDT